MNDLGIRADRDVFRDDTETRAGFSGADFQAGLVWELVLEHIQIKHEQGVVAGGFEEGVVPLERVETLRGAFAIQGLEELALRVVALQLRVSVCRKEKNKYGKENFLISSGGRKKKFMTFRAGQKTRLISSGGKKNPKISRRGEEKF